MSLDRIKIIFIVTCILLTEIHAQKHEMRGVWISSVSNLDWPTSKNQSPSAQRQSFIDLLDDLKRAGINTIFMQVRPSCDALYQSDIEPWSEWLTGQQGRAPQPFYDPLQFIIEETHNRGMEFHAWLNPFRAVVSISGSSISDNHISRTHPQWMITYGNLKILNPGIPEARAHIIRVVQDIIKRYPVDGIHFDDYFYPYPQTGQTINDEATFIEFKRGFENINDWRRDNINTFIRECRDSIKAFDKRIKYGVSPFGIWRNRGSDPSGSVSNGLQSYDAIYADSKKWVESGWLDYVVPQIYWAFGFSAAAYDNLVPWWSSLSNPNHLYIGQGAYRLDPSSSTIFSNSEIPNQIRYNRSNSSVQGSLLFRAGNLRANHKGLSDSLELNMFKFDALRPKMPWLDSINPEPPTQLSLEYGDGKIILNWSRSGQAADGEYASQYAIYRFKDGENPEISSNQNIIHITSRDEDKFEDIFSIDPTLSYTYIVTALDRLHNESNATCISRIESKLTSIKEELFTNVLIYPNPFKDILTLDFNKLSFKPQQIEVLTTQGQLIKKVIVNSTMTEIDLIELRSGIYFIAIDRLVMIRVVKE
jgi:uncharacterized lipoprotein YddW (UPF0748 family)